MTGATAPELIAVLEDAQRLGLLGSRPIPDVIAHARGFVRALEHHGSISSVLDLGSGAGVPGLIIAHDLPTIHVTLLDRRAKRTDLLQRVVRRLGWHERVSVVCEDVARFGPAGSFDAVVARGFGPPDFTLSAGERLVRPGGPIVISEPPGDDRWDDALLERLSLRRLPARPSDVDDLAPPDGRATTSLDGLVAVFVAR
jgi:16S rRNA (guanine527-N7)-methyltransferase